MKIILSAITLSCSILLAPYTVNAHLRICSGVLAFTTSMAIKNSLKSRNPLPSWSRVLQNILFNCILLFIIILVAYVFNNVLHKMKYPSPAGMYQEFYSPVISLWINSFFVIFFLLTTLFCSPSSKDVPLRQDSLVYVMMKLFRSWDDSLPEDVIAEMNIGHRRKQICKLPKIKVDYNYYTQSSIVNP